MKMNRLYVSHDGMIKYLYQLKQMANSIDSNDDMAIKLFSSISSIELSIFSRKGDFQKAQLYAENIELKLEEFEGKVTPSRKAFLAFKMAVVHIGTENYSEALKWINKILNDPELDKTEDIVGFTQLLDLLVHIELNHNQI